MHDIVDVSAVELDLSLESLLLHNFISNAHLSCAQTGGHQVGSGAVH